jgi:protease I
LLLASLLIAQLASRPSRDSGKDDPKKKPDGSGLLGGGKPPAKKPRVLFVLGQVGFHYPDYGPVREVLEENGVEVRVGSAWMRPCSPDTHGGGVIVQPDLTLREVRASEFDALIFCGGTGTGHFMGPGPGAQSAKRLIEEMIAAGKPVAAICMAPAILAEAGVLVGREVTCTRAHEDKILSRVEAGGAKLRLDQKVVVDGLIITGRDPQAARPFAEAVVKALKK